MARTRQTARKSTGGKAPRKCAAQKYASNMALLNQGVPERVVNVVEYDIDYMKSFYEHYFYTGGTDELFDPVTMVATTVHPLNEEVEHYVGFSFNSKCDGLGIDEYGRPALDLVLALDISGSMNSPFPGDNISKSKIQVAKECILSFLSQIRDNDQFSLIVFNKTPSVIQPLQKWSDIDKDGLYTKIQGLRAGGGTTITNTMDMATSFYGQITDEERSRRIFFFTDMEVSNQDGKDFTDYIERNSKVSIWSSIVGVGLDLSCDVIERISKTAGCNYSNVRSSELFNEFITNEFDYAVTPIAFNIDVSAGDTLIVQKGYGSYEIENSTFDPVHFSAAFPSSQNENNESRSGLYLMKVDLVDDNLSSNIKFNWTTSSGIPNEKQTEVTFTQEEGFQNDSIRKAIALVHYTDFMQDFIKSRSSGNLEHYSEMRKKFPVLLEYFRNECLDVGDKTLKLEYKHLLDMSEEDDIPIDAKLQSPIFENDKRKREEVEAGQPDNKKRKLENEENECCVCLTEKKNVLFNPCKYE
eukprot:TRINITY_DN441_c0_g1_i3.p1 TRINITY_DN441_c0_g1~~TRINITY_DN441_c0_g1_i3.p1  ORF type:complete len:526 (-),score=132.58 TRINITY_DN441_c0_g1_i3:189-1766(-)